MCSQWLRLSTFVYCFSRMHLSTTHFEIKSDNILFAEYVSTQKFNISTNSRPVVVIVILHSKQCERTRLQIQMKWKWKYLMFPCATTQQSSNSISISYSWLELFALFYVTVFILCAHVMGSFATIFYSIDYVEGLCTIPYNQMAFCVERCTFTQTKAMVTNRFFIFSQAVSSPAVIFKLTIK